MKTLLIIASLLFTASLYAQKPITGAFGYTLGQKLDQNQIISGSSLYYQVKPLNPFRNFSLYIVLTCPSTGEIAAIAGTSYHAEADAQTELDICKSALEKLYGKFDRTDTGFVFKKNNRTIRLLPSRNQNGPLLMLNYEDDRLCAQAEREVKERQNNIPGAFGFQFGQQLNRELILSEVGPNWFQVKPIKPSPIFHQYGIELTPKTKKIYAINGIRPQDNSQQIDEIANQMRIFYGNETKVEKIPGKDCYTWDKEKVLIMLHIVSGKIWVTFSDKVLFSQAEAEAKSLELEKTDSSAL